MGPVWSQRREERVTLTALVSDAEKGRFDALRIERMLRIETKHVGGRRLRHGHWIAPALQQACHRQRAPCDSVLSRECALCSRATLDQLARSADAAFEQRAGTANRKTPDDTKSLADTFRCSSKCRQGWTPVRHSSDSY